ncbi:hypothetical protein J7W19_32525 [Streptomyces mobaraensis NBRC 13819 = DSM 40847]|uniref:hypothetical protein n=1 Tax=Streptomyces mobaraensis TaxID=35621 RepID=UPI001B30C5E0|nr:hypothetical protein [Streptomyces mobaraensis]QTT72030.1 hypothetical protein J7W19_00025 [Streptomyces mobaraensis NBRC 13819 = DSM 40847]QTT77469.1 hypothetical protein J7W19_32525 [Streptomyces mobaraensis NBRC 13819 = DSM 40847]
MALARAARHWANPRQGRITVDPTPATVTSAFLARDILAALGRTAYAPTHSPVITAQPAWRAAACWITIDDIRQLTVLRAHMLTPERTEQLSVLREVTGIRLILIASGATTGERARLTTHLAEAGLAGELEHLDTPAALRLFTQHAAPRPSLPSPRPARQQPSTTRSSAATVAHGAPPARRSAPRLFGQHRAGLLAAHNWLAWHRATLPALPDQRDVELFLSRLTALSPTLEYTTARIHGARDGFAAAGLRLAHPADLAAAGGPGICTVPFTAQVAYRISRAVPGPTQVAALAALLCTGAATDRLVHATVDDVHHDGSRLALPEPFSGEYDQDHPPPRVWYAIPPHARPYLQAARLFRQLEGAPGHFHLFSKSFGHRLKALVKDASHPIPTLDHPHPGPAWHHQARLLRT